MGAEPGFISSHTATTGTSLVQTSPNIQAVNGESAVTACQLMSISPQDSKAYLCDLNTMHCIPAGFAATNHPLSTNVDDTTKVTLIRQGRIRGFSGLVPGALYYPSADTAGGIVPERATVGPVITAITATSGSSFLRNVHIRAGHRPIAGNWTITFPSSTTCTITPPGGSAGAAFTVANNSTYNGTITGAESFFIETRTITTGCTATVTVSYSTEAAILYTLDSPRNAFVDAAALPGMAGKNSVAGIYQLVTTSSQVTVEFNGSAPSWTMNISPGSVYFTIIPGMELKTQSGAVTAETNYFLVGNQELAAPVGIAINESTIQILMGGIG